MNYNNYFPTNYHPLYQHQPQVQGQPIWVQGEAGAKSYLVAPNNTVQLWDSESQTIYLKSADASGMPSIRILDYTIRQEAPRTPVEAFKDHDGIDGLKSEINGLKRQVEALRDELDKLKGEGDEH